MRVEEDEVHALSALDAGDSIPKDERIQRVVEDALKRKRRGEFVSDKAVAAAHPDLAPELADALVASDRIYQQILAARTAGQRDDIIEPLSASKIDQPITLSPIESPEVARPIGIQGYRFNREISRGGQAAVFQATQESTGRAVAVKVMAGGPYITTRNRARFEREVQILATLDHPGIVRIVDRGRTSDGSFFFVMDFIDGQGLDEFLDEQRRHGSSPKTIVTVFKKIADALDEAHRRGIIHRDLKPSNIVVDARGEPHVLDFGLARLISITDEQIDRRLTYTGHVIGSMPWASPEQASGDLSNIGSTSDIYSLGVLMYHAFAGRFPYEVIGTLQTVTRHICTSVPIAPERLDQSPFGTVDGALSRIILKALSKKPKDRYPSASVLAAELDAYLHGRTKIVRTPAMSRRVWKFLAVCLFVCSTVAFIEARRPATSEMLIAELPHYKNSIEMELVQIPSGSFTMGAPFTEEGRQDTEQEHAVTITKPFYIGRTEVTRKEYREIMGALPFKSESGDDNLPVNYVTRNDADEFCRRLTSKDRRQYRLPTEAEWEYACRGGTPTPYAGTGKLAEMGWYSGNSGNRLHPVASKHPNHWGLYDMQGNVAEWCSDQYTPFLGHDPAIDPVHRLTELAAVVRGGSAKMPAGNCRAAWRTPFIISGSTETLGFRVIMEPPSADHALSH